MRIHADKIESGPPHGLCARDVRLILARVPPDWIDGLKKVRLANGWHRPRAYFSRFDGCLTIYSRCGTKTEVLVALLSTLASPSLNITNAVARGPSRPEQKRINQFIQPLVDKLLPELTAPRRQEDEYLAPWQPMSFSPFPNDNA